MSDMPMVTTWRGVDIRRLSREELEQAFRELGAMYQFALDSAAEDMRRMIRNHVGR